MHPAPRTWIATALIITLGTLVTTACTTMGRKPSSETKAARRIANVVPSSFVVELEERLVRKLMASGAHADEAVIRKEVRTTLINEFSKAERRATPYSTYDELVESYRNKPYDEFDRTLSRVSFEGLSRALNAQIHDYDEILRFMRMRFEETRLPTTHTRLVDLPENPNSIIHPTWVDTKIKTKYTAGVQNFVLHGNTQDLIRFQYGGKDQFLRMQEYMENVLLRKRDVVITYDIASGLQFRDEASRKHFFDWVATRPNLKKAIEQGGLPKQPGGIFPILNDYFRETSQTKKIGFIIDYGDNVLGRTANSAGLDAQLAQQVGESGSSDAIEAIWLKKWANDRNLQGSGLMTVMVAEKSKALEAAFATEAKIASVKIPRPSYDEKLAFIKKKFAENPTVANHMERGFSAEMLARESSVLNLSELDVMLNEVAASGGTLNRAMLVARKMEYVERLSAGMLKYIPENTIPLRQMQLPEETKGQLETYIKAWKEGRKEAVPTGIFVFGTRGTGKTTLASVMCRDAGMVCLELGNFFGSYVGQTEANIEKIMQIVNDTEPVLLFIDEFSKKFISNGAGGVQENIQRQVEALMLPWVANTKNRGKVLFMGAAADTGVMTHMDWNRRFPTKIMVSVPRDVAEKKAMMRSALDFTGLGHLKLENFDANFFEMMQRPRVASDYENAIAHAKAIAEKEGKQVDEKLVQRAFIEKKPAFDEHTINQAEFDFGMACDRMYVPQSTVNALANAGMPLPPGTHITCDGPIISPF